MRLKFAVVTLVTGMLSSFTHAAVCPMPVMPQVPDGGTASGAEMLRAKKLLESYIAEIDKYLECDATPIKQRRAQQRVDAVMALFEDQMKIYREKS